jgi:hypothetical protein
MSENDLMSQMESLPLSLRYGVRQLQTRINRNTNLLPIGKDDVTGNGAGIVRFRFPSASIINLSSISISFNTTISGLSDDATNWVNALVPSAYKYVKRAQFFLGGVACCGSLCQEYNQVYHAMLKATTNTQYCYAKTLNGFTEVSDLYDKFGDLTTKPTASTKSCFQILDDFLLLARGNGASVNPDMFIDTSLWNDLELELLFDNNSILSVFSPSNNQADPDAYALAKGAQVSWALSNIRLNVDCISSIPGIYGAVMELRTSRPEPIRLVFQNIVSQVAVVQGTNRIQVSSTSIDGLMICGLVANYNTAKAFVANTASNVNLSVDITNNNKFNFVSLGLNENSTFSAILQVGTTTYPTTAYNSIYLLADSTFRHYWHNSIVATSLLYQQYVATVISQTLGQQSQPYVIGNFLTNQFIWVQSFCLEDGWSSASKTLSGIDTQSTNTDILIITNVNNNQFNLLMIGLLSSYLEYDTQSRRVRVIQ